MILLLLLGVPISGRIVRGPPGENSNQISSPLQQHIAPMNSKEMIQYITQVNTMILRNVLKEGNLGKKMGFHHKMNLPQMVKLISSNYPDLPSYGIPKRPNDDFMRAVVRKFKAEKYYKLIPPPPTRKPGLDSYQFDVPPPIGADPLNTKSDGDEILNKYISSLPNAKKIQKWSKKTLIKYISKRLKYFNPKNELTPELTKMLQDKVLGPPFPPSIPEKPGPPGPPSSIGTPWKKPNLSFKERKGFLRAYLHSIGLEKAWRWKLKSQIKVASKRLKFKNPKNILSNKMALRLQQAIGIVY